MEITVSGSHRDAAAAAPAGAAVGKGVWTHACINARTWMWVYTSIWTRARRQRDPRSHRSPPGPHADALHNLPAVFVCSTLLPPVCFFNLTVCISQSKPVRVSPAKAISVREKQIKGLMKAKSGSWPHSDWICSLTVISKAVKSSVPGCPVLGSIHNGCLFFKTYHDSIFIQTFVWTLFYIAEDRNCNDRLCIA